VDTTLKKRLIGAIVLIALAVIFLPMLVKGPAQDNGASGVSITVPNAPGGGFETRELPLVTPGSPSGNGAVGMNNGTGAPAPVAAQTNPDAADPAATSPETTAGNYVISFGAYATVSDADTVVARLKDSTLPGFREEVTVNGRPAWRVRIGPYGSQVLAEAARLRAVKVRSDVNAQVIALDAPTPAAPATTEPAAPGAATPAPTIPAATPAATATPPKPAETPRTATATHSTPPAATIAPAATPSTSASASDVGFAVQLGAFSSSTEANVLRDKVRDAGFSAFVEQVRTDNGTLNRVRVGPFSNRVEAERMKALIVMKVGVDGMVRQHP
jgi:cell division septation protein DedD